MTWTDLLTSEMRTAYSTAASLLDRVDRAALSWKPSTGSNWMTTGQLLRHLGEACGAGCRAFLSGDWGLPPGVSIENIPPEIMLPPAETLPTVESLDEARRLLASDRALAFDSVAQAGEAALSARMVEAP